jgi:hypothetical protein
MNKKELGELMEKTSEQVLNVLTSVKGLLILSEHYANPPETNSYLMLISACITKLEEIIKTTQDKIKDEDSQS